jgi:hypothetical protein
MSLLIFLRLRIPQQMTKPKTNNLLIDQIPTECDMVPRPKTPNVKDFGLNWTKHDENL